MKLRNVLTVLGAATVTAVLTLALLAPWSGKAQAGAVVHPVIGQAQLTSQNCTFSLTTDKAAYEAGQAPKIEVKAVNPTNQPVSTSVWVVVTSTTPTSPMSRMLPMPTVVWSHEYAFQLGPDETKSLSADCVGLPALGNVSISMTDQKATIMAGSYGVPAQGQTNTAQAIAAQQAALAAAANGKQPNAVQTPAGRQ
jgi:hypothetical protein